MKKSRGWGIFLVVLSAFVGMAGGMLYAPTIPFQAEKLGAPKWIVTSLPMGFPSIVSFILLIPIGIIADKSGRRKIILLVAMGLTVIADLGLAFSHSWSALAIWRIISGLPFTFMTLYGVIISFLLPEEKRGSAMALGIGGAMLGMGSFQAISGYLVKVLGGYAGLYYLGAILAGLSFLFLLPVKVPVVKSSTGISGKDIGGVLRNKKIIYTGITLLIYLVGWQMMYGAFPVILVNILKTPVELQTVFFAIASTMLGFGTFIWGPVIDKLGARKSLFFAFLLSAVATIVMILLLKNMWGFVLLFWLATIGGVCGAPGTSVVAMKSVKPELATIAVNMMFMFVSLPAIIGGIIAGPIMAGIGLGGFVLVSAILELIASGMTFGMPKV